MNDFHEDNIVKSLNEIGNVAIDRTKWQKKFNNTILGDQEDKNAGLKLLGMN